MHDDCDNEWLYEDLEDDAMMDLLIGDIVKMIYNNLI